MNARIDTTVTSGTFSLDGETFNVDNNVWLVGDDTECVIIDAPHDVMAIVELVGDRRVIAIACTHGHDDHVRVALDLGRAVEAPVLLHPADASVWALTHDTPPDGELSDGQQIPVGGTALRVIHTPGHTPGAVCFYAADLGVVFTGDTLFPGGLGRVQVPMDFQTVLDMVEAKLFVMPDDTVIYPGHGDNTTIGAERPRLHEWRARGW